MGELRLKRFDSKFGGIVILWKLKGYIPKIQRIFLVGGDSASVEEIVRGAEELSCEMIDATIADMLLFFSGKAVEFDLETVDLEVCSPFQKKVLLAEYEIPRGYVSSYKRMAEHIGKPDGTRAVGNALAHNPFPIVIPCHRTIRSNGGLGGFGGGTQMKYQLLKMEGIKFNNRRQALPGQFYPAFSK